MPGHDDYVGLIRELVCLVYECGETGGCWDNSADKENAMLRSRMYEAARKIMYAMCQDTLSDKDIDIVFWDAKS